jgi:hypothetical protein
MKSRRKKSDSSSSFIRLGIICLLFCVTDFQSAKAAFQVPDFYYYYDEKIPLHISEDVITICFEHGIGPAQRQTLIADDPALKGISDQDLPFGLFLIVTKEGLDKQDITQVIERLNKLPQVRYSAPVFAFRNMKLILMDEFVVRFKADVAEESIGDLNNKQGVTVVSKGPYRHNRYVLRVTNPKEKNAIEVANAYNGNPHVNYATPNFAVIGGYFSTYPNDTYFAQQWALHNTGQSPPAGTPDADVDAPEAWDIATNSNIIVAVIDSGVDYTHPDLAANMWKIQENIVYFS